MEFYSHRVICGPYSMICQLNVSEVDEGFIKLTDLVTYFGKLRTPGGVRSKRTRVVQKVEENSILSVSYHHRKLVSMSVHCLG